MTLTIEVPERVVKRAAELGVPVDDLVREALEGIAPAVIPPREPLTGSKMTREEAGRVLRDIARTHTLGGIRIKDLIEEGRRY